jgi:hypothetical protein
VICSATAVPLDRCEANARAQLVSASSSGECLRNAVRKSFIDIEEVRNQATSNCRVFDFVQFECERRGNVFLFALGSTDIELPSLTIMVGNVSERMRSFGPSSGAG